MTECLLCGGSHPALPAFAAPSLAERVALAWRNFWWITTAYSPSRKELRHNAELLRSLHE